jgi:nicotinamide-nucleotide amidase
LTTDFHPDLAQLAARVIAENKALGRKICVAESCTGGLVAAALTEISGSSAVFQAGFVTYSNEAKTSLLGVNAELIETFGAVSEAVAWAMARGAIVKTGSDVAVSITGVAGPDGGSPLKPVGTVVFALAKIGEDPEDMIAGRLDFGSDKSRSEIRQLAALHALSLLLPSTP